jgi:hypothetical protein
MATRSDVISRLKRAMGGREFAIGLSFLELLAQQPVPKPRLPKLLFWAPENLLVLARLAESSERHRVFLLRVMRSFVSPSAPGDETSPNRITSQHVDVLIANLKLLVKTGRLRAIVETDPRLEDLLEQVFPRTQFGISLSPEQNFVARYVSSVLRWSKKTGKAFLEAGERVINHVGSVIGSLRIPDRVAGLLEAKEKFALELLGELGISKTTKKLISIATAAIGAIAVPAAPLAGAAALVGFWIALTDP